jgi:hypothetical protein
MFNLFKKKTITHEQIREYPVNNGLFSNSILIFQSYDTLNKQFIQVLYVLYKYYNAVGLPEMATRVLQHAEPLVEEDFNDDQFNTFILPFRLELLEKLFEIYIQWEQQSIITTQEISDIASRIGRIKGLESLKGRDAQEGLDQIRDKRKEYGEINSTDRKLALLPFCDAAELLRQHYESKSDTKSIRQLDTIVEYVMNLLG